MNEFELTEENISKEAAVIISRASLESENPMWDENNTLPTESCFYSVDGLRKLLGRIDVFNQRPHERYTIFISKTDGEILGKKQNYTMLV